MTTETVEAVCGHGTFRLVAPLNLRLAEAGEVSLIVEPIERPEEIPALAAGLYEGLTEDEIDSIEGVAPPRADFFGGRRYITDGPKDHETISRQLPLQ
ncbi:MAG: hypothetical protein V2B18_00905 [Pseudomonadota bacterium]